MLCRFVRKGRASTVNKTFPPTSNTEANFTTDLEFVQLVFLVHEVFLQFTSVLFGGAGARVQLGVLQGRVRLDEVPPVGATPCNQERAVLY